jgi:hypothetical protein
MKIGRHQDSAKWRSFTAERLMSSGSEQEDSTLQKQLTETFLSLLKALGYRIKEAELGEKLRPLLGRAIELGKVLASQRAMYQFFDPRTEKWWSKRPEDEYCRNEEDDDEPEGEGEIAFISVPALMKRGTGMGEDLDQHVFLSKALVNLA